MNKNSLFVVKAPESLSSEVQLEYFKRLRNGDLSVREELINHNINLVIHVVKTRFYDTQYDMNDLVSEGIIGLMTAVDTFDYDITPKFSTYAVKVIENQILMLLRKPDKKNISLEETLYTKNEENGLTLGDTLRDKNVDLEEEHLSKDLSQIIIKLIDEIEDERERDIVKQTFGFGCERVSQRVLAEKYKVRQPTISRILSKSIRIIAYKLERMDLIEIPSKQRERLNFDELIELIEKNKVKINIPQVDNKTNKRFRTIYEIFKEFSHEEVDYVITLLPEDTKHLLYDRYGNDLDNPNTDNVISGLNYQRFYSSLLPKMRRLLKTRKSDKEVSIINGRCVKAYKTIYELFEEYSHEEIDAAVSELNEEELRIVHLKYGNDLKNTIKDDSLTKEESKYYYAVIKNKIKTRLVRNRKNKENNLPSKSVMVYNDSENELNNLMTKDDYIKVVSFLKKMNAREMFRLVNPQDLIITSLRFGYVEDKYYSIKAISKFLGITEREVLESIKRTLDFFNSKSSEMKLTYKEKDNE